jgi:hypothetical protein
MNEAQLQHKAEQEEKYSNLVESVVTSPVDVIVEQMKYIHDRHSLEYVSEAAFQKLYQLFLTLQFEDKLKLLHFVADIVDEQEQDKLFKAVQDGSDYDKINFLVRFRIGDVMSGSKSVIQSL